MKLLTKLASSKTTFLHRHLAGLIVLAVIVLCGTFIALGTRSDDGSITLDGTNAQYSDAQRQALCELDRQKDEAVSTLLGLDVPQDAASGCEPTYPAQMGSSVYYKVDVSTPTAFVNAVNGRGFNEGFGLQCVAGFKQFMYSLSGRYIATKTGGASGYAQQQAQIEPLGFTWHGGRAGMQDGDWAIFGGGTYGHVAMYYQGKLFGQNQGAANADAGNPFNLLDLGSYANQIIGFYRPNIYQKTTPAPTQPDENTNGNTNAGGDTNVTTNTYSVQRGDTLGGIALKNGWWPSVQGLFGDSGYAQRLAETNNIPVRGLIYPEQVVRRVE